QRGEFRGTPASIPFTGLAKGILVKRPHYLAEAFRGLIENAPDQGNVVLSWAAHARQRVAQVEFHSPTADVQMSVLQVFLPVEDVAAGEAEPASDHAIVAEVVLDQIAVVGAVISGPQNQLLPAADAVGDQILAVRFGAHPADAVVVDFLVYRFGPGGVGGFLVFTGSKEGRG